MTGAGHPRSEADGEQAGAAPRMAVVRSAYDRLFAGDLDAFLDSLAPDCVLIEADSLPYGGRHVGRERIEAAVLQIMETWSEFRFDIAEMLAGETSVIAYGTMVVRGRQTGIEAHFALAERWVVQNGQVSEISAVYGDTVLARRAAGAVMPDTLRP